jgi:putative phosphoesterase
MTTSTAGEIIGIIADMHGDLTEYKAAMHILDSAGVSRILCAGDIADRGGNADAIIQDMQQRGVIAVKGNHDYTVVANQNRWRESERAEQLSRLGRIVADDSVSYLRRLPATVSLTIAGFRVMMAHGTPWSDVLGIFPTSRSGLLDVLTSRCPDTDILVLGHTHEPMDLRIGALRVINPGSVYGATIRDSATCGLLHLPSGTFEIRKL